MHFENEEVNIIIACTCFHMSNLVLLKTKFCILILFEAKFWNCRDILESKNGKWCVLTLFKPMNARKAIRTLNFRDIDSTNRQWKFYVVNIIAVLYPYSFQFFDFLNWRTCVRTYAQLRAWILKKYDCSYFIILNCVFEFYVDFLYNR